MENQNPFDPRFKELVTRFEQMMRHNQSAFFDADELEDIIDFYGENGDFTSLLSVVEFGLSIYPLNHMLMLKEAQALLSLGKITQGIQRLKKLEKIEKSEELCLTLASVYSQQREHQKSIKYLREALSFSSGENDTEIYLEMAFEYENMSRFDKAKDVLKEAILKFGDNEMLLHELAFVFENLGGAAESVEYFSKLTDVDPYSYAAWYNLGNALQSSDQVVAAIEAYDYCIAIQEDFTPAYYNKAHCLFKQENYIDSIRVFEETYAYEPPQAHVFCHIGECFEKLQEFDKAIFYYRKSISADESYADAYLGIGLTLDFQGKTEEGLAFIDKAMVMDPDNTDYLLFKLDIVSRNADNKRAHDTIEALLNYHRHSADMFLDVSEYYMHMDDFERAMLIIDEGIHELAESNQLLIRKASYYFLRNQMNECLAILLQSAPCSQEEWKDLQEVNPDFCNHPDVLAVMKWK